MRGQAVAQRITNAENSFVEYVAEQTGCSLSIACAVMYYYLKERLLKIDPVGGVWRVRHGFAIEVDTLKRAVQIVTPSQALRA